MSYPPLQLYELVADVARYPEFLPWCHAARIRRRESPTVEIAELAIGFGPFHEKFVSRVVRAADGHVPAHSATDACDRRHGGRANVPRVLVVLHEEDAGVVAVVCSQPEGEAHPARPRTDAAEARCTVGGELGPLPRAALRVEAEAVARDRLERQLGARLVVPARYSEVTATVAPRRAPARRA